MKTLFLRLRDFILKQKISIFEVFGWIGKSGELKIDGISFGSDEDLFYLNQKNPRRKEKKVVCNGCHELEWNL